MKRFFVFLLVLCLSVSLFVVPVFAASSYTIVFDPPSLMGDAGAINLLLPPELIGFSEGFVSFTFGSESYTSVSNFDINFELQKSSSGYSFYLGTSDVFVAHCGSSSSSSECYMEFELYESNGSHSMVAYLYIMEPSGFVPLYDFNELRLVLTEKESDPTEVPTVSGSSDTPMDTVDSGLVAAVSWVGDVVDALMFGPLSGLLGMVAIAISISALLLVIRLIRKFGWGI